MFDDHGRTILLAVVVSIGLLVGAPAVLAADIVVYDPDPLEIEFGPGDETVTEAHDVTVESFEENETTVDVEITNEPAGVDVSHPDTATLSPGSNEITLDVTVEDEVTNQPVEGTIDGVAFSFDVTATQPPWVGFEDEPLDVGEILVDDSEPGEFEIEEIGGHEGIDGVEWEIVRDDPDGDLEFSGMSGFGGVSTEPGGSDTAEWTVTVEEDARQHAALRWTVEVWEEDHPEASREIDVEGTVIYPAAFGDVDLDDTFTFDEPRDEGTITQRFDLDVENEGDLELDVGTVTASADHGGIDVDVARVPATIDGGDTEAVELDVTADTDVPEGEYEISGTASSTDVDVEGVEYTGTIEVEHETELSLEHTRLSLGDIPTGESEQGTTSVSEELGYNDVSNLEIERKEGPDSWLTEEEIPTDVSAGQSELVVFEVEFDTEAELGSDYQWTYVADGEDVDPEEVTIEATPVPLDLDPIRDDLSAYEGGDDGPIAEATIEMLDTIDEQMREGDAEGDDISTMLTYGTATAAFLDAVEESHELIDDGEHEEAQSTVTQAAAAYNTMDLYADALESDELRSDGETVMSASEDRLAALIDEQEAYYESRLEEGDDSLLEQATITRQLSRIALLQGDDERAESLETEASETFEAYSESVEDGESAYQNANQQWEEMEDEQFVMLAGQPLLLNPAKFDAFTEGTSSVHDSYEESISLLEEAGETSRAEEVAAEHQERSNALETARLSLFGAIGVYALFTLGVVTYTARSMFWYVRDARSATTGDFLI